MEHKLLHSDTSLWVSLKKISEQINTILGQPGRQLILSILDLLVQQVDIIIIEWQVATEQCIKQNTHTP